MQKILYNLSVLLYASGVRIASLFNEKARLFVDGRKAREYRNIPAKQKKRVWIHAASLGEFEQGRPLIEALKATEDVEVVLTFFSPSGYEIRKDYDLADWVYYLPIDTVSNATDFLESVEPDIGIIVKYEFWLNHIAVAHQKSIPLLYISVIFRDDQIYFNKAKSLYTDYFSMIDHFFVQDQSSQYLLDQIGVKSSSVAGDTRFDRVIEIANKAKAIEPVIKFIGSSHAVVFGSVWASDMDEIDGFVRHFDQRIKMIIAPHNLEYSRDLKEKYPEAALFSSLEDDFEADILIIDNIGMLSSLYQYARYAFVGGGFRGALHNVLEPAVFGAPVFFGNHKRNAKFNEATDLSANGGGIAIENGQEMIGHVERMENDQTLYDQAANSSYQYTRSMQGATEKIMSHVRDLLR